MQQEEGKHGPENMRRILCRYSALPVACECDCEQEKGLQTQKLYDHIMRPVSEKWGSIRIGILSQEPEKRKLMKWKGTPLLMVVTGANQQSTPDKTCCTLDSRQRNFCPQQKHPCSREPVFHKNPVLLVLENHTNQLTQATTWGFGGEAERKRACNWKSS